MKGGIDLDQNELYHYGVLGMKWGIRKDRKTGERKHANEAYAKASNKLRKLDSKITKQNQKTSAKLDETMKLEYKRDNSRYKSKNAWTQWGRNRNEKKYEKLKKEAFNAKIKYEKAVLKTEKASEKAQNWYKQMEKTFANITLTDVNPADIDLGRTYAAIILEASRKGGRRTNWD